MSTTAVRSGGSAFHLRFHMDEVATLTKDEQERQRYEVAAKHINAAVTIVPDIDAALSGGVFSLDNDVLAFESTETDRDYRMVVQVENLRKKRKRLPFLTERWLARVDRVLTTCANSLDWTDTISCLALLVRIRTPILALPFVRRSLQLLRVGAPQPESITKQYYTLRDDSAALSKMSADAKFRLENEMQMAVMCQLDRANKLKKGLQQ